MHINQIPEKLRPSINSLIAHALYDAKAPEDTKDLEEWFQVDGWDELLSTWSDGNFALNLYYVARLRFDDAELLENEDLDGPITDQNRIDFARNEINQAVDEMDGVECPSIHTVTVTNEKGEEAILGWTVEIHGQGGAVGYFLGSFRDKDQFFQRLRDMDYVLRDEIDLLTDEKILSFWNYDRF